MKAANLFSSSLVKETGNTVACCEYVTLTWHEHQHEHEHEHTSC